MYTCNVSVRVCYITWLALVVRGKLFRSERPWDIPLGMLRPRLKALHPMPINAVTRIQPHKPRYGISTDMGISAGAGAATQYKAYWANQRRGVGSNVKVYSTVVAKP